MEGRRDSVPTLAEVVEDWLRCLNSGRGYAISEFDDGEHPWHSLAVVENDLLTWRISAERGQMLLYVGHVGAMGPEWCSVDLLPALLGEGEIAPDPALTPDRAEWICQRLHKIEAAYASENRPATISRLQALKKERMERDSNR